MTGEELRKLAFAHLNGGDGLPKNEAKGWQFMEQAAQAGDQEACIMHASHLLDGKKFAESVQYFEKGNILAATEKWVRKNACGEYIVALLSLADGDRADKETYFAKTADYIDCKMTTPYEGDPHTFTAWVDWLTATKGDGVIKTLRDDDRANVYEYYRQLALCARNKAEAGDCLKKLMLWEADAMLDLGTLLGSKKEGAAMGAAYYEAAKVAKAAGDKEGAKTYLQYAADRGYKLTAAEQRLLGNLPYCVHGKVNFEAWKRKGVSSLRSVRFMAEKHSEEYAKALAESYFENYRTQIAEEFAAVAPDVALPDISRRKPETNLIYEAVAVGECESQWGGKVRESHKSYEPMFAADITGTHSYRMNIPGEMADDVPDADIFVAYPNLNEKLQACRADARRTANAAWNYNDPLSARPGADYVHLRFVPMRYFVYKEGGALIVLCVNVSVGGFSFAVCADGDARPLPEIVADFGRRKEKEREAQANAARAAAQARAASHASSSQTSAAQAQKSSAGNNNSDGVGIRNIYAVLSLVFAFFGVTAPLGVIFGITGLQKAKEKGNKNIAVVGLVISALITALIVFVVIALKVVGSDNVFDDGTASRILFGM